MSKSITMDGVEYEVVGETLHHGYARESWKWARIGKCFIEVRRVGEVRAMSTAELESHVSTLIGRVDDLQGEVSELREWRDTFVKQDHILNLSNRIARLENEADRQAPNPPRFFFFYEKGDEQWFWHDSHCAENIGPFANREEAEADYRTTRKVSV